MDTKKALKGLFWCEWPGSNRHGNNSHRILSPGRLPIPPHSLEIGFSISKNRKANGESEFRLAFQLKGFDAI